jgi:hypothetical protein
VGYFQQLALHSLTVVDYGQDAYTIDIGTDQQHATLRSENLSLNFIATVDGGDESGVERPNVVLQKTPSSNHLGDGITAQFRLYEGQSVSFVLCDHKDLKPSTITNAMIDEAQTTTHKFWARWISQSKYHGRWEDVVTRSLFILKMLTYEPTGAIVAAPTFSLPEDFGGEYFNLFLHCMLPRRSSQVLF